MKIFLSLRRNRPVQPDAWGFDGRNRAFEDGGDAGDSAVCDSTGPDVTAGILVPFLPYKSYTSSPQSAVRQPS